MRLFVGNLAFASSEDSVRQAFTPYGDVSSVHLVTDRDTGQSRGFAFVEMEAAELYTLAARYGCRALAVLTVSDHLKTHEALPSEEREKSFGDMVEIALEAAFTE